MPELNNGNSKAKEAGSEDEKQPLTSNNSNNTNSAVVALENGKNNKTTTSDTRGATSLSRSVSCAADGQVVILNVGGQRHESMRSNFERFPNSRLWKVMKAENVDDILMHCDRYKISATNDDVPEYFFDRNYASFINILDAYRTGILHLNASNCAVITRDDMKYWGMDELLIEPCCAVRYYPEIEVCQSEIDMEHSEQRKTEEQEILEDFGQSSLGKLRKSLWNLFEYPQTSKAAQFVACFSLLMIVVSTGCFILSCIYGEDSMVWMPDKDSDDEGQSGGGLGGNNSLGSSSSMSSSSSSNDQIKSSSDGSTNPDYDILDTPVTTLKGEILSEEEQAELNTSKTVAKIILWVDAFTAVYFTIEYVTRLVCTPRRMRFFIQPMNLVDLFAILPYFINFIVDHLSEFHIIGKAGKVVRLVRVTKILRVFKLVRHFAGLQSLFFTIRQASRELGLLVMLIGVSVLTFSSLVYFAEKDDSTNNWSFMDSFWWGLLTITTVGNGTEKPETGAGKIVGGVCAIFGIFTLILPIPIVVNSFAGFYRNRLWRNEVAIKKRDRLLYQIAAKDGNHVELNGMPGGAGNVATSAGPTTTN